MKVRSASASSSADHTQYQDTSHGRLALMIDSDAMHYATWHTNGSLASIGPDIMRSTWQNGSLTLIGSTPDTARSSRQCSIGFPNSNVVRHAGIARDVFRFRLVNVSPSDARGVSTSYTIK